MIAKMDLFQENVTSSLLSTFAISLFNATCSLRQTLTERFQTVEMFCSDFAMLRKISDAIELE